MAFSIRLTEQEKSLRKVMLVYIRYLWEKPLSVLYLKRSRMSMIYPCMKKPMTNMSKVVVKVLRWQIFWKELDGEI